ncbi:GIY-YIG nuclease family protein [Marinobacter nauticus]|uniref:GIY-YIG nuclease family protein n=1 Tax=Marinobacter nauticus TaxID=2743 RepID=UPI001C9949FB|nr:GIY-YIG nuclease family protein [Marinobacter nauticus]MBY5961921.1 GIY-YIG nuclease family protein [Marinobacter nauticus]
MSVIQFPDIFQDHKTLDRQAQHLNETIGWVYILSNDFMPGLLKIGYTCSLPELRCKELSRATGVPSDFFIEDGLYCFKAQKVEAKVHKILSEHRVNPSREFFKCSLDTAMCALWAASIEISDKLDIAWPGAQARQMALYGRPPGGGRLAKVEGMEL